MPPTNATKSFAVPLNGDGEVITVGICEPDIRADNLNLTTWTASFILARQLHKFGLLVDKKEKIPVLEIGAGTGLVGLTAALILCCKTVLTDLPGIVPGLRANVDLNINTLGPIASKVQCGSLDWRTPEILTLESGATFDVADTKANIILAADTIYDDAHPELLSRVILTWLARTPSARAILAYPLRVAYLEQIREIWTLLEEGGLECEIEGQEQAETRDWDDELLCEYVVLKWKSTGS
ncbi:hypothetical protein LTS08_002692 [Lithohypha guttulata]|uniref:Uncharacterized protein n=1 Tax=Lithohypha guttulata TaxID=1690604 RepID=A0AAN7YE16_9EURO|nr:hypothetical protein LTR51_001861 [Lithohypha guttulata]KAK5090407.1 hypothetical protein LTR05_000579 [Lithohypha guttulata]KAK5104799.1 hypothetical protein LTS08_002692 [Lithohypha guttulata]